ncbi:hypothetical protein VNO77_11043 [Canavalia gladiata]|uniref:Uncharacterized protein n=1 Tax=Canavalia gladiata TaxID=3824 RepID=A0AAN9MEV9_CANGL
MKSKSTCGVAERLMVPYPYAKEWSPAKCREREREREREGPHLTTAIDTANLGSPATRVTTPCTQLYPTLTPVFLSLYVTSPQLIHFSLHKNASSFSLRSLHPKLSNSPSIPT